ncbi:MAG: universal stress protein [Acidimicrobiales bacterium]|nr:universal stress protein [Acidimicrobiales bacterium]
MKTTSVIVPIGDSRDADTVMAVASDIAERFDALLEVVHVTSSLHAGPHVARRRAWMTELAEANAASLRLVEDRSVSAGLRDVLVDHPDAIVCMHVDASGGPLDVALGSTSQDLLRAGHHRFVLLGPEVSTKARATTGPVVVCVDASDHSESILTDASRWADAMGSATTWVVFVAHATPMPADVDEGSYVQSMARALDVPDSEWEVLHGKDPAHSIVDFAERIGASTIVMATHGRSGLGRLALGSTTARVVHQAPCPVLTRRPPFLSSVLA